jgi:D-lactate dehydrogenase
MKIAIFEIEPREATAFEHLKRDHELVLSEQPLRADNVGQYADAAIVCVFIYSKLDRDVLEKLPALELIATRSTGYDHIFWN